MMSDRGPKKRVHPVIRVFISSTFSDLKRERDALQQDVFPKLELLCANRQFRFQAIDLRWGVSTEAGLDHRSMRICFAELERAQELSPQPNFLILLGNRYGWRPLPEELGEQEFARLEASAARYGKTDLLCRWFRRDENATTVTYLLQSRLRTFGDGVDYRNAIAWKDVESALWRIINDAYPPMKLARRFGQADAGERPLSIVRIQASATEQEIWRGALQVDGADEHVVAFFREIDNLRDLDGAEGADTFVDIAADGTGAIDSGSQLALQQLKAAVATRLGERNILTAATPVRVIRNPGPGASGVDVTTTHINQMCKDVFERLEQIIVQQMDQYWQTESVSVPSERLLALEIDAHRLVGLEMAPPDRFVGRELYLRKIADYLSGPSRQPLVIRGASGSGKTALLAKAVQNAALKWEPVVRFIGTTPASSDLRSLLSSLCQQFRERHPSPDVPANRLEGLTLEFQRWLGSGSRARPIVLFLDALDQLGDTDDASCLHWLPQGPLPEHAKLVVSCRSDRRSDPVGAAMAPLLRHVLADDDCIDLDVLSISEAYALLFERWLAGCGRRVNDEQRKVIERKIEIPSCRQPLYLKILVEEVKLWCSYDQVAVPGNDVPQLLAALFDRLEDPVNHGATAVHTMRYLASTRRGLTETEILEILLLDADYRHYLHGLAGGTMQPLRTDARRVPTAVWARLRNDLAPYLSERAAPGGTVINFYHRAVADYARERLLGEPTTRRQLHQNLASYFEAQEFFFRSPPQGPPNARKVDELPWQYARAERWDKVHDLYGTIGFLEGSIAAGLLDGLVADTAAIPSRHRTTRIESVRRAILANLAPLRSRPAYALQTLRNGLDFMGLASGVADLVAATDNELTSRGLWLAAANASSDRSSSDEAVWEFRDSRGAPQFSLPRGIVYAGTPTGTIEEYRLETGELFNIRRVTDSAVLWLAVDRHGQLAWRESDGGIHAECTSLRADGRKGEDAIEFLDHLGLVMAQADDTLVLWHPQTGAADRLLDDLAATPIRISASEDQRRVLVVATTTRSGQQVIDLLADGATYDARRVHGLPAQVTAASVSPDGRHLLLALQNRTLLLLADDLRPKATINFQAASAAQLSGGVLRCALPPEAMPRQALFALYHGNIAIWDIEHGAIRVVGEFRGQYQRTPLYFISFLLDATRYVASTAYQVRIATVTDVPADRPPVPITACALGSQAWAAIASEAAQYVQWLHGTRAAAIAAGPAVGHPTALAFCGADGAVVVGNLEGHVWRQSPHKEPTHEDGYRAFDRPVASLSSLASGEAVAADESCIVRLYDFDRGEISSLAEGNLDLTQRRVFPLSDRTSFVSWVTQKSGGAMRHRIEVIVPRAARDTIHTTDKTVNDVDMASNLKVIAIAESDHVWVYRQGPRGWRRFSGRSEAVRMLKFCGSDKLAVVLDDEEHWLEIWSLDESLPTIAAARASGECSAIAASPERLLLGTADGHFQFFTLQQG